MLNAAEPAEALPDPELHPFLKKFMNDRLEQLEQMKKAVENQEFEFVRSMAHQWKGFCAPFGLGRMTAVCQKLEREAANNAERECKQILSEIASYLQLKVEVLREHGLLAP